MIKIKSVAIFFMVSSLSVAFSGTAQANEVVFCVNKSSRVVTYPSYGVCKSDQIVLKLPTDSTSLPTVKNHTDTVKTDPKQAQKVFIPNVLGMEQKKAELTLSSLKLKVSIKYLKKGGQVVDVLPKIGTQVVPGSVVVLVIG